MPPTLPHTLTNGTPADAAQVMNNLNTVLAGVHPVAVSSLPGSPYDGQEVFYIADAAAGVQWHLKYRAGSASSYKWEVVGASRMNSEVVASEAHPGTSAWANLATDGPSVVVPRAGEYDCDYGARGVLTDRLQTLQLGLTVGDTSPAVGTFQPALRSANTGAAWLSGNWMSPLATSQRRVFAASDVVKLRYWADGAYVFLERYVRLVPVRVS